MKKILSAALCVVLTLSLSVPARAADPSNEAETAAVYLREQGIMVGDSSGAMNLDSGLTRAQLATVLTRLHGNPEHVQADQAFYSSQCKFPDVPEWARLYVGYCYSNGLMVGYDTGVFGAGDGVTPQAACTVILRYLDLPGIEWDYSSACQAALDQGLTTSEAVAKAEVTRGDLAVMLYRAIEEAGLPQPGKSSCFFCPSMRAEEIIDLREHYPDLFRRALALEDNARANLKTVQGLGRNYSWRERFGKEFI